MDYLKRSCRNNTAFKPALIKDLENNDILVELQALGLIGKLVTGPWMTILYSNKLTNLETVPVLQTCIRNMKLLKDSPGTVLAADRDMFGGMLTVDADPVLQSLKSTRHESQLSSVI